MIYLWLWFMIMIFIWFGFCWWYGTDINFSTNEDCQNCAVFETNCQARITRSKLKYMIYLSLHCEYQLHYRACLRASYHWQGKYIYWHNNPSYCALTYLIDAQSFHFASLPLNLSRSVIVNTDIFSLALHH